MDEEISSFRIFLWELYMGKNIEMLRYNKYCYMGVKAMMLFNIERKGSFKSF